MDKILSSLTTLGFIIWIIAIDKKDTKMKIYGAAVVGFSIILNILST